MKRKAKTINQTDQNRVKKGDEKLSLVLVPAGDNTWPPMTASDDKE